MEEEREYTRENANEKKTCKREKKGTGREREDKCETLNRNSTRKLARLMLPNNW